MSKQLAQGSWWQNRDVNADLPDPCTDPKADLFPPQLGAQPAPLLQPYPTVREA